MCSQPHTIPSKTYLQRCTHTHRRMHSHVCSDRNMHVEEKGHKLEASMVYIVRSLSQNINKG